MPSSPNWRNVRPTRQCPTLLDQLPTGDIDLALVPETTARRLFEAFRLEMRYDRETNKVHCQVTITPEVIAAQREAAADTLNEQRPVHNDDDHARVCAAPRVWSETDGCTIDDHAPGCLTVITATYDVA